MLTQTRGAEPYRGVLGVGSRCCSCWKRQLGGRTFSAEPALACRRSLTQFYSAILPATRAWAIGPHPAAGAELKAQPETPRPASESPGEATGVG